MVLQHDILTTKHIHVLVVKCSISSFADRPNRWFVPSPPPETHPTRDLQLPRSRLHQKRHRTGINPSLTRLEGTPDQEPHGSASLFSAACDRMGQLPSQWQPLPTLSSRAIKRIPATSILTAARAARQKSPVWDMLPLKPLPRCLRALDQLWHRHDLTHSLPSPPLPIPPNMSSALYRQDTVSPCSVPWPIHPLSP